MPGTQSITRPAAAPGGGRRPGLALPVIATARGHAGAGAHPRGQQWEMS